MLQGAQFLAVATVVVYAGAILVTFLFVLMLAQPEGRTYYDRLSWEALVSSATGAGIVADSREEAEWDEIHRKAGALLAALEGSDFTAPDFESKTSLSADRRRER